MEMSYDSQSFFTVEEEIQFRCWEVVYGAKRPFTEQGLHSAYQKVARDFPDLSEEAWSGLKEKKISLEEYKAKWMKMAELYSQSSFMNRLEEKLRDLTRFQELNPMLTASFPASQYEMPLRNSKREEPSL